MKNCLQYFKISESFLKFSSWETNVCRWSDRFEVINGIDHIIFTGQNWMDFSSENMALKNTFEKIIPENGWLFGSRGEYGIGDNRWCSIGDNNTRFE